MKAGGLCFPAEYRIDPGKSAQALATRPFASAHVPRHTHLPASRKCSLILIVCAVVMMAPARPGAAASLQQDRDGFYCIIGPDKKGTYSFALRERSDKKLDFGVSLWWPDGKNVAVTGVALPSDSGWRYEAGSEDHCVVTIAPEDRGYSLTIDQAACESYGGFNAVPAKVWFTQDMRQGPAGDVLANPEVFVNTECKGEPRTASPPLKVQW